MIIFGLWVSAGTSAVAVSVQPLLVALTVRVYVPGVLTTGFCWVDVNPAGPVHCQVTLALFAPPVNVMLGTAQVINPPAADAMGALASGDTTAVEVEVQPFGASTVSV